jgi:dolichol-phosphate mannosyltransferase
LEWVLNTQVGPKISVVTPVYGCASCLSELCQRLHVVLAEIDHDYEIILVNDGSRDHAWQVIQELAVADTRVKGINLSRNFGHHHAITAGLDFVRGEWVVVMDCDLQDVPEEIPKLYQAALSGYDIVVGRRANRQDGWLRKQLSKAFYKVFAYLTETKINPQIGSFGVYSKKVIENIAKLREQNRSLGLFALWVGHRRLEMDIVHAKRQHGKSSYSARRMLSLAFNSTIAHSDKLLRLTMQFGFMMSLCSFLYALWIIAAYFFWSKPIVGWASLIVSIYFSAGMIIGALGIVGLYVGKIFAEVKGRPLYLIDALTFGVENE